MASAAASPLSPSPHIALLAQHSAQQKAQLHQKQQHGASLSLDVADDLRVLVPTPASSPMPLAADAALQADQADVALPLPSGWTAVRTAQLALAPERRSIPQLRIDTADEHLLRRGLWAACACMYLPLVTQAKAADGPQQNGGQGAASAAAESTVAASAGSCAAASSLAAPSTPPVSSPSTTILTDCAALPTEDVASLKVPRSFLVSVVSGGITNQLYRCALAPHDDQPVLVRIYGPRTELVIDRSKENEVVDVLSTNGEGPKIYGRFENGRLESWLPGSSLNPAQMREPTISRLIAGALSRLHVQNMPFPRESVIASVLSKWSAIASEVAFPESAEKAAKLAKLDLPSVITLCQQYISATSSSPYASTSAIVFAHNDLLSGNVMHDAAAQSCKLVDFEYGNYNPRAFDLANHFCECCGFDCDWAVFPDAQAQLLFIRAYLAAIHSVSADSVTDLACRELYAEVQCWMLAPHLFWLLWAIVQAKYSPIDFDYLSYAGQRLDGFRRMQPACEQWLRKTKEEVSAMQSLD